MPGGGPVTDVVWRVTRAEWAARVQTRAALAAAGPTAQRG